MFKKILLGIGALFFVLTGGLILIMGYVFNNPDSVFNAFHSVTDKLMQGQKYEENGEFFLQGISKLGFETRNVEIDVQTHNGPTLKVLLEGKVPRFEQGPFILQTADSESVNIRFQEPLASHWIQMNVNGQEVTQDSNAKLKAHVYLPSSFKGHILISTRSGNIKLSLPEQELYELDLQTVSGKIDNTLVAKAAPGVSPDQVGHIKVTSEEGSITVEPSR
ncbi:hypothetical protein [Bdellovibrio bacteriovorus]|uniref:hypothetical protein n=1 Tax=Bdellovibrio bacteriovorus TaxID=959 RepID=UPI0035A70453